MMAHKTICGVCGEEFEAPRLAHAHLAKNSCVPRIYVSGNEVRSTARNLALTDNCACWPKESIPAMRKLLTGTKPVVVTDATAHSAALAFALDMMSHGVMVKAKIEKGY
jgi:hypothetical protein